VTAAKEGAEENTTRIAFAVGNSQEVGTAFFKWFINSAENLILSIFRDLNSYDTGSALISLESIVLPADSHWQSISFESGYYINDPDPLVGIAIFNLNIPFIIESYTPSFFGMDFKESYAECGLLIIEDIRPVEVCKYSVERENWLLRLEICG
jgi:hypothetical protein